MPSQETPRLGHGIFLCLTAYLFFAIAATFVRLFPPDFPTLQILFFQCLISLICLICKMRRKKQKLSFKTSLFSYHFVRAVSSVLSFLCFYLTIKYTNLVDASVLNATSPFYIPFIWLLLTKEKIEKQVFWAVILGFIGVAFILQPEGDIFHPGSFLGILAGMLSAVGIISISLLNRHKEPTINIIFYFFFISLLALLPFLPAVWKTPSFTESLLLLGSGISFYLAQSFLTKAFQFGTAAFLSPLSYSTIIYLTFISYLFLGASLSWHTIVGIVLVVAGGTTTFILSKRPTSLKGVFARNHSKHKWGRIFKRKNKKIPENNSKQPSENTDNKPHGNF